MRRTLAILSASLLATSAAYAVTDIAAVDWNGDDFASYSEMMIAYPGIDREDFESIDQNGDNRIDATELYETAAQDILARHEDQDREIRVVADTDGDGYVDYEELSAVYAGLTDIDFMDIDLNDDNRVDTWEFYEPRAQTILARYEMNGDGFEELDAIDADGNDFISFEELTTVYSDLPRESFEAMDSNDDQRLDFTEYYSLEAQNAIARQM
jgi:Ca2+-binding EF-hand superfamily protein